ncbi:MAG: hypothetical protein ABI367_16055, partial [Mucilaginibacter sp.]
SALYDNKPAEGNRTTTTERLKKQFGNRYIVLPNPAYGDFENALFKFKKLTNAQKDSVIHASVKTYKQ